jgi:MFS transporter, MHS family, proline/betaine transporter
MVASQSTSDAEAVRSVTSAPVDRRQARKAILAAGTGNALEWYDFAVFAFLTPVLSQLFFPGEDRIAAILSTFAVFAVGFVMRPIGAILFGRIADKRGRKAALIVSVTLMGVATLLIGIMPTYASVGLLAPALLVVARMLQGLSVGGEFGASASFLVEYAPPHRRGFYGSLAYFSANAGSMLGGLVVLLFTLSLTAESMTGWGWRVPFLLSFPLLAIGMYLRARIAETPQFEAVQSTDEQVSSPLSTVLREHWKAMLTIVGIAVAFAITSYTVLSFILSYLITVIGFTPIQALTAVVLATAIGSCMTPVFGALSDTFGRRPILIFACLAGLALPYPGFLLLQNGTFGSALLGMVILWVPVSSFCGVTPATFAEMFPTKVRVSGFGVAYGFGTALFSGTAPFVATLLVDVTGSSLAPAWYVMAAALVSLCVILPLVRETRHDTWVK